MSAPSAPIPPARGPLGGALLAGLVTLFGAGCVPRWKRPTEGVVETAGVVLRAEDGAFQLAAGKPFRPPFYARDCVAFATWDNWPLALKWGARRVRVTVPGHATPLYGVLSLCEVHPKRAGPAGDAYRIKIPREAPTLAAAGRPIVIVKETDYGVRFKDGFHRFDAWQLWLSTRPFPAKAPLPR